MCRYCVLYVGLCFIFTYLPFPPRLVDSSTVPFAVAKMGVPIGAAKWLCACVLLMRVSERVSERPHNFWPLGSLSPTHEKKGGALGVGPPVPQEHKIRGGRINTRSSHNEADDEA